MPGGDAQRQEGHRQDHGACHGNGPDRAIAHRRKPRQRQPDQPRQKRAQPHRGLDRHLTIAAQKDEVQRHRGCHPEPGCGPQKRVARAPLGPAPGDGDGDPGQHGNHRDPCRGRCSLPQQEAPENRCKDRHRRHRQKHDRHRRDRDPQRKERRIGRVAKDHPDPGGPRQHRQLRPPGSSGQRPEQDQHRPHQEPAPRQHREAAHPRPAHQQRVGRQHQRARHGEENTEKGVARHLCPALA